MGRHATGRTAQTPISGYGIVRWAVATYLAAAERYHPERSPERSGSGR